MGIDWRSKTIMTVFLFSYHPATEIERLHHASCGEDAKHCIEVRVFRNGGLVQGISQSFTSGDIYMKTLKP